MVVFAHRQRIRHFFKIQMMDTQSLCLSVFKVPVKDPVEVRKSRARIFIVFFFSIDVAPKLHYGGGKRR